MSGILGHGEIVSRGSKFGTPFQGKARRQIVGANAEEEVRSLSRNFFNL